MLLINKILTVLNLLGATALMVFLSADVLRRHDWNRAAEGARIVNEGLPQNETDEDPSTPARFTDIFTGNKPETMSSHIDKELQDSLQLGNLKAQATAVNELKKGVYSQLENAKEPGKSIGETARFLLPLADTYSARERLIQLRTFQAPDAVNKRLVDHLDKALTVTFQKWAPPQKPEDAATSFATAYYNAVQLGGPMEGKTQLPAGEGRHQLAEAFVRALTAKAGGSAKFGEAAMQGSKAGGDEAATVFLRTARGDEGKTRAAMMEDSFFEATNLLLQMQFAAAIRPALDSLRNRSNDPGEKPFFNYTKITRVVDEIAPRNEDPLEKKARDARAEIVKKARAAVDTEKNLPDADKQRVLAFRVAYLLALEAQPGEPKDPYSLAMVNLLTADPTRVKPAFDAAEKAWPPAPLDLALDSPSDATAVAFVKKLLGPEDAAANTVEDLLAPKVKEILAQLAEELRADLDYEFELATNPNAVPRRAPRGVDEDESTKRPVSPSIQQREALAKILFCLTDVVDPSSADTAAGDLSAGMKKVIRIVGLRNSALELVRETTALEPMPNEVRRRLHRDRDQFLVDHHLVEAQVQDAAVAARQQVEEEARYDGFNKTRQEIVNGRKADVKAFTARLEEERAVTKKRLERLDKLAKDLFDTRVKVHDAIKLTQQYEDGIQYLESRDR